MRTIDLTFDRQSPLPQSLPPPRECRAKPLKGRASHTGFKHSKSSGSKEDFEAWRVEGVSLSKMRSSKSNYLQTDSAILAQEILREQEEILGLLENSSFLTHSLLARTSAEEGLSEQQHFIKAFEEVERAKLRLMYGPYPSRDSCEGEEDALSTAISVDSLELSPKRRDQSANAPLSNSVRSPETSLREDVFLEMDYLLSSDTEEAAEAAAATEEDGDCLEDIQQELHKRIPSKLEFHRETSQEREASQANRKRSDRYRLDYRSDEDIEGLGMEPRQPRDPKESRLQLDPSDRRAVSMMVGSLPEWLVLCVRSYQSVFLNEKSGEDEVNSRLARCARRFLQVERYLEKMEREVSEITIDRHERGKRRALRRLKNQQSELESSRRGRSSSSNQRELMSRSVSSLVSGEAKHREADSERGMKDDGAVEYHAFNAREGRDSQVNSTLRKGRMLLLSAAISFGDVVGEMIAHEVEGLREEEVKSIPNP